MTTDNLQHSLGPWLKPTIFGPLATFGGLAALGSAAFGVAAVSGGRLDSWLQLMLFATFLSSGMSVCLIMSDLFLLKRKLRQLPTGGRAWISSCLTPMITIFLWGLPIWPDPETMLGAVAFIMLPIAFGAFISRLLFSARV